MFSLRKLILWGPRAGGRRPDVKAMGWGPDNLNTHKNIIFSQISIEKNKIIISDDLDLSEEFSTFFEDAVRSLDEHYLSDTENLSDSVEIAIRKF